MHHHPILCMRKLRHKDSQEVNVLVLIANLYITSFPIIYIFNESFFYFCWGTSYLYFFFWHVICPNTPKCKTFKYFTFNKPSSRGQQNISETYRCTQPWALLSHNQLEKQTLDIKRYRKANSSISLLNTGHLTWVTSNLWVHI